MGAVHVAAGDGVPIASSYFERLVPFDWEIFARNMDYLREFFWSNRVVEWIPFAGLLAVVRRSRPLAGLLAGWFFAYVLIRGSTPRASVERGDFWRLVMPAFPAFAVLVAAVLLLVPGLLNRLAQRERPVVPIALRRGAVAAGVVLFAVVPLLVTAFWPLA